MFVAVLFESGRLPWLGRIHRRLFAPSLPPCGRTRLMEHGAVWESRGSPRLGHADSHEQGDVLDLWNPKFQLAPGGMSASGLERSGSTWKALQDYVDRKPRRHGARGDAKLARATARQALVLAAKEKPEVYLARRRVGDRTREKYLMLVGRFQREHKLSSLKEADRVDRLMEKAVGIMFMAGETTHEPRYLPTAVSWTILAAKGRSRRPW